MVLSSHTSFQMKVSQSKGSEGGYRIVLVCSSSVKTRVGDGAASLLSMRAKVYHLYWPADISLGHETRKQHASAVIKEPFAGTFTRPVSLSRATVLGRLT